MALNKVTYTDDVTVIEAQNLNEIQDEILRVDPSYITGKGIGENADLNTFNTPGVYFCANSVTAATLVNSPVTSASFSLIVLPKSTSYQTQIINAGSHLYSRQKSSTGWADWYTCARLEGDTFTGNVNINLRNGTASSVGDSIIILGNATASGTDGNSRGVLRLYGTGSSQANIYPQALTATRNITLPDASGTIALQNSVIEGTSFTGMTSVPQYPRNVMETIRTDIASYSNGIYNVASSGGPQYFAHIGKYNNNYWAAMLQTYTDSNIYFVQYANGTCKVRIISQ